MNAIKISGVIIWAAICCDAVFAQDAPTSPGAESGDSAAMLAAWQAASHPGDPHAMLADQVGRWRADATLWMEPGGEPTEASYSIEREMELGGRVLHEAWSGSFMGQAFHGIGRTGYDNVTDRYWATWTDNMSTGLMVTYGERRDDGSVEMSGRFANPLTGNPVHTRIVWSFPDDGTEVMESFEKRGDEEFMNMKMTLTRVGSD